MSAHLRVVLAMAAALSLGRAQAAEVVSEGTSSPQQSRRALGGHVFQPTFLLTGPFTETSFGMATLAGGGELTGPRFDIAGKQFGSRHYTVGAYGQQLDLHLGLTPDIALRMVVQGLVFSGLTARDLLLAGATAQYGVSLGATAGKNLGGNTRLSLVLDMSLQPQFSLLIGNAILRATQTGSFDGFGLRSNVERIQGAPGLSFAWAPIPALGIIAETRYLWTRRITSNDGSTSAERVAQGLSAGGQVALDFDPLVGFPVAVQGTYRGDFPVGSGGIAEVHQVGLGFYYSRRVRLALGLEVVWRHGDLRPGVEPTLKADAEIATIWLRYYW
jgi:hypothetical protein